MDGYLQNEQKEKQAMLKKDLKVISFLLLFVTCNSNKIDNKGNILYKKSITIIGKNQYCKVLSSLNDSLDIWVLKRLSSYEPEYTYNYELDSLLCFNSEGNRFIGSIHVFGNQFNSTSDDLQIILGEKINKQWYFFSGSTSIVLPRKLYQKNETTPLSYQQLHQIALKEVYGGYLNKDGTINEHWFISHFEGAGWVNWDDTPEKIKSYTRKDYEQFHLKVIRNNWNGVKKDSIKQLQKKDEALP